MKPTVAVIGASPDRRKFGNKAVRAFLAAGYEVFPVNPTVREIEGLTAYPSVKDVPVGRLDRVTVYLPPAVGLAVLPGLAATPVGEVWLNPGADAPEVVAKARALGLNVVTGCSILGVGISPHDMSDE
jgi:predicted CoA-binding protein